MGLFSQAQTSWPKFNHNFSGCLLTTWAKRRSRGLRSKPRYPTFHLASINLSSLQLNLPVVDAELVPTVDVANYNAVPVHYSAVMSIFYGGYLLGSALIEAGSQDANFCQLHRLPARLDGLEFAHQAREFLADVTRREMAPEANVDIGETARVLWWDHRFKVHVDSHVTVDPRFLDVVDQKNRSELKVFVTRSQFQKS